MNFKIFYKSILFLSLFFLFFSSSFANVTYYQSNMVNSDGSITLTINYKAQEAEINKSTNMIGGLPFDVQILKEYFSFTGCDVNKFLVYNDQNDASIKVVTLELEVKDISKINLSKVFSQIKTGWVKSDSGLVFSWLTPKSFMESNMIATFQFLLTSESEIKSTNGVFKDNTCRWYVFTDKIDPRGAYFVTTLKNNEFTHKKIEEQNNSDGTENQEDKKKTAVCLDLNCQ